MCQVFPLTPVTWCAVPTACVKHCLSLPLFLVCWSISHIYPFVDVSFFFVAALPATNLPQCVALCAGLVVLSSVHAHNHGSKCFSLCIITCSLNRSHTLLSTRSVAISSDQPIRRCPQCSLRLIHSLAEFALSWVLSAAFRLVSTHTAADTRQISVCSLTTLFATYPNGPLHANWPHSQSHTGECIVILGMELMTAY